MKKILSLILALCLLAFAATSLADGLNVGSYDPASAGTVEIGFGWWGNQVRDAATLDALALFTENYPNVTFNPNAQNWSNYWSVMKTSAADNSLPDLMQQDYAFIEQWVESGDLLDLTPYVESGALDISGIPEAVVNTGKVGDGLYALCAGVNAPSTLYNKTLTDKLGITVPTDLTWDDFVSISKQIVEATGGYAAIYGNGNSENPVTFYARSCGHTALFEKEGTSLTAEEATIYYQDILDGVKEGWMYNTDQIANVNVNDIAQHPLVFGATPDVRSWCALAWSNQMSAFQKAATADGIELGICTWPSRDVKASNFEKSGQFFSVTTDSKNPDLAVAVLNYLINDVQGNIKLQAERGVPANSSVAAAIADEITNNIDPAYGTIVAYLAHVESNCSAIYPPLPAYAGTVNDDVIKRLSDEVLMKDATITAEEAGADFVDSTNDIAASY